MTSLRSRPITFESLHIDISSWWRPGAAVMVTAACLMLLGTRMQEGPVLVTGVSEPAGSGADRYVELRHRVEATLPALRVTNGAAEIRGREAALGAAVRTARPHAMQGEVFTPAVSEKVREIVTADLMRRSALDRASLMSDVPVMQPRVNEPYPTGEALATFPPLLLQVLPRLPADLEYRFMRGDLIIRDSRTNLIVDYLPDVTGDTGVRP